jgi:hypothetical protein
VSLRANYATVFLGAQLGPDGGQLNLDWATAAGDATDTHQFEVPTAEATEGYLGIQAFDVGAFGHEIEINGETLPGFDIPPNPGWQYWVDTLTDVSLRQGINTVRVCRDTTTADSFAVGNLIVHWKEPAAEGD